MDDIELTRAFLGDLLQGYGFDVVTVATAEEALKVLTCAEFDLVITDQLMPEVNGWALLRKVRALYPDLPVLLYSSLPARPGPDEEDLAFDASLLKPASSESLLEQILRLCGCPSPQC